MAWYIHEDSVYLWFVFFALCIVETLLFAISTTVTTFYKYQFNKQVETAYIQQVPISFV